MTVPAFKERPLDKDEIKRILDCEKPRTFSDFMVRRVGLFGPKHLSQNQEVLSLLKEHGHFLKSKLLEVPNDLESIRKTDLNSWH